jgi:hypothetical protein
VLGSEMKHHPNKNTNNNSTVRAAVYVTLATTLILLGGTANVITPSSLQSAEAQRFIDSESAFAVEPKAPMAVSQNGNNVYIVWWTNQSGNWEVMFRASTDSGQTFGDKINLSNSTDTESQNAEIVAFGNNVYVSWWETNPENGSSDSMLRVSTDRGQTFGPVVMLSMNGTISTTDGNNTTGAGAHAQHLQ